MIAFALLLMIGGADAAPMQFGEIQIDGVRHDPGVSIVIARENLTKKYVLHFDERMTDKIVESVEQL